MQMAVASTTGQAFHLLSPLVGFIYLLLHLTGVDMGAWQRTAAKWSIGTFIIPHRRPHVRGSADLTSEHVCVTT